MLIAIPFLCLGLSAQADPYRIPLEGEDAQPAVVFDQAALDAKMAEIMPRLVEMRGWKFHEPVAAGIQSTEDFMLFAAASAEEEYGPEGSAGMMTSAILFGLIPDGQDLDAAVNALLSASVGGYYDPKTRKFWLMKGFAVGPLADILMAHELQHALDDQQYPLDALMKVKGNSDRVFAVRSVVEGSATSAMNLYMLRAVEGNWIPPGELFSANMIGEQMKAMNVAPVAFVASLMLPYLEGNLFLVRGGSLLEAFAKLPSDADLRRAFEQPPLSSEQILHPEKYWDVQLRDDPLRVEVADHSVVLGAGWRAVDEDTLGEFGCAFLAAPRLPTPLELQFGAVGLRTPAAAGWGGDRYRSYLHESGARVAQGIFLWDTEEDAIEFEVALAQPAARARAPYLREVSRQGNRVELLLADDAGRPALARLRAAR